MKTIAILCGGVLLAGYAHAADMPIKAVSPTAAYDTWTGFYIGVEGGGQTAKSDWTAKCFGAGCVGGPGGGPALVPEGSSPFQILGGGGVVGGYAGFNWQISKIFVVGVETNYDYDPSRANMPGLSGCSRIPHDCVKNHTVTLLGDDNSQFNTVDGGSVRGRLGFVATPYLMFYGAGGFAWQAVSATETCGSVPFAVGGAFCTTASTQTNSTTRSGWTIGAGLEYRLTPQWILRGDYRFSEYQWGTNFFSTQSSGVNFNVQNIRLITNTGTAGLAYKF